MRTLVLALLLAALPHALPTAAQAQDEEEEIEFEEDDPTDRPTSGDMSLFSGRTMGNGEVALAAGLGWPGIWAGVFIAPTSTINFGIRGHVYYGSPVMALTTGVGGGLTVPIRIHLFGADTFDLSIWIEPSFALGEGRLVGQLTAFAGAFGFSFVTLGGLLAGAQLSDMVTLSFGLAGEIGLVSTPDNTANGTEAFGGFVGQIGIEALMARDTMLFVHVEGGVGFSHSALFGSQEILRAWAGLAYLL